MIETPQIGQTEARHTAIIPMVIPRREMPSVIGPALKELLTAAAAQGLAKTGPWFAHHLSFSDEIFDFEVSIPVAGPFLATGRAVPGLWPAGPVARAIYRGDYAALPAAWDELRHWIDALGDKPDAFGYARAAHIYEVYTLTPPTAPSPADYVTELNWPLTSSSLAQLSDEGSRQ